MLAQIVVTFALFKGLDKHLPVGASESTILLMQNFELGQVGRWLIAAGLVLVAAGTVVILLSKTGLFRLPGDFEWSGRNWKIYFPLMTSLILSVILTLAVWLYYYFRK